MDETGGDSPPLQNGSAHPPPPRQGAPKQSPRHGTLTEASAVVAPFDEAGDLPMVASLDGVTAICQSLKRELAVTRATQQEQLKLLLAQQSMFKELAARLVTTPTPRRKRTVSGALSDMNSFNAAPGGSPLGGSAHPSSRDDGEADDPESEGEEEEAEEEENYTMLTNASVFQSEEVYAGVLNPEGPFRVCWDVFMLVLLLYVAVTVPLLTFFDDIEHTDVHICFDVVVDLLFIMDILLNFRTGYMDAAKILVLDKKLVRRRYLHGWFVFDLVSSIPVQILTLMDRGAFEDLIVLKLIRLLKLGRLSRVSRIKVLRDLSYSGIIRPGVVRVIKLLIAYFFVTHIVACLYWGIAKSDPLECASRDTSNPWGVCAEVREGSWTYQYSYSFYWALIVMMGNDAYPQSHGDKMFTTAIVLIGMLVNSVVIGSCASLLANLDQSAVQKQQQFDAINDNLAYHKVSGGLARKVRSYYDYLWACGHHTNEERLFHELPEKLRVQLMMTKKKPLIEAVDLFQNISAMCTVDLVEALSPVITLPREYVMVQGQLGDEMYFINRGLVQITCFVNFREVPIRQLTDGGHFGEVALLNADRRRTANALTIHFCDLQMLSRATFEQMQQRHPEFLEAVQKYADKRGRAPRSDKSLRDAAKGRLQLRAEKLQHKMTRRATKLRSASHAVGLVRRLSVSAKQVAASEPACCWTTEAADKQAMRKSAEEVFAEAARCVEGTKKAAGACRQGSPDRKSGKINGASGSFEGEQQRTEIRFIPGMGAQAHVGVACDD